MGRGPTTPAIAGRGFTLEGSVVVCATSRDSSGSAVDFDPTTLKMHHQICVGFLCSGSLRPVGRGGVRGRGVADVAKKRKIPARVSSLPFGIWNKELRCAGTKVYNSIMYGNLVPSMASASFGFLVETSIPFLDRSR